MIGSAKQQHNKWCLADAGGEQQSLKIKETYSAVSNNENAQLVNEHFICAEQVLKNHIIAGSDDLIGWLRKLELLPSGGLHNVRCRER
jgi:hypothetical protein